jgi:hypothetical protein
MDRGGRVVADRLCGSLLGVGKIWQVGDDGPHHRSRLKFSSVVV